VLAAVVRLLDLTFLRVGNDTYARVNRSFGLSTLRDRHARVAGSTLHLRFRGKGGRVEERSVVDRRLATIVRRCQDLPGQELFQYVDEDGNIRQISSEDVNAYIRDAAGLDDVSAKDFRTWTATVLAFRALQAAGADLSPGAATAGGVRNRRRRDPILEALRRTAEQLGDTLAVTRSSYVHPAVVEAFDDPEGPATATRRRRQGPPSRAEERDVLALLRSASTSRGEVSFERGGP
jgi:DNA topoisomerase I